MHERPETSRFYRMRLPHWEVVGGRYFVTIRLKGAIPAEGLRRIRYYLQLAESAVGLRCTGHEERKRALAEMERCLHAAPRVAYLANRQVADCVTEAIHHREKQGIWTMFSYVIMPNHIHLFFRLGPQDRRSASRVDSRSSRVLDERAIPIVPEAGVEHMQGVLSQAHRASDYNAPSRGSRVLDERASPIVPEAGVEHMQGAPSQAHRAGDHNGPRRGSRVLDERASLSVPDMGMGDEERVPSQAHRASDYSGPTQDLYLDRVIMDFKRWTANQAAAILGISGESFWQREWFDHWSRSAEEDKAIEEYIRRNPLHVAG
jgi:REP element-mobilizing transposase RayT